MTRKKHLSLIPVNNLTDIHISNCYPLYSILSQNLFLQLLSTVYFSTLLDTEIRMILNVFPEARILKVFHRQTYFLSVLRAPDGRHTCGHILFLLLTSIDGKVFCTHLPYFYARTAFYRKEAFSTRNLTMGLIPR